MANNDFHDASLIISALEKKELLEKSKMNNSDFFLESVFTSIELLPFIHSLLIKIGLNLKTIGTTIASSTIKKGFFFCDFESKVKLLDLKKDLEQFRQLHHTQPIFYQLSYILALENLCEAAPSKKDILMRGLAIEIARIHHHLQVLKNIFTCAKSDKLLVLINKALKAGKNIFSLFSSVKTDLLEQKFIAAGPTENTFELLDELLTELEDEASVNERLYAALSKKAIVSAKMSADFGLTGLFLKACRTRQKDLADENKLYLDDNKPALCFKDEADAYARCLLRIDESKSSLTWLISQLKHIKKSKIDISSLVFKQNLDVKNAKNKFAFGEIKSPEGTIISSIFKSNYDESYLFHLSTPAYFIAQAIPNLIFREEIKDLPIILATLGITAAEIDK